MSENFTNINHFFSWDFKTLWSSEIDEDRINTPYSQLGSLVGPKDYQQKLIFD
jgi:hypothetical protein